MNHVSSLGYVGLNVTDLDAWRALATDVLGLSAQETDNGGLRLRCDEREYRAELFAADTDSLAHLGLEVHDPATLEALSSRLESLGYSVKQADASLADAREVTTLSLVDDPAGNRVELYVGQRYADRPFVSSTGARFVTQGLGFGHAFLAVPDLAAAQRFYIDGLGFRISDRIPAGPGGDALFLRCNPRHHSIGLAQIPDFPTSLLHIMFEVDDLDTVGHAYDKCRRGAAPIVNTLGRHSNDLMLSFYLRNPSGFDVEFGTDGLQIDETSWNAGENRYNVESFWGHIRTPENVRGAEEGWEY
ncbi:VOC family protein [Nocardia fluminea]|uniref:VOC family protein n=1 Tax=Nocardia fluminea TaxID=134984 RepID=UPI0033D8D466